MAQDLAVPPFTGAARPGQTISALGTPSLHQRARVTAQEFEAVFLNAMFQQMFTGIEGDGPFGGASGSGVWRSFLTDEYAKSFARAGGVGIGAEVYRTLIAQQEGRKA